MSEHVLQGGQRSERGFVALTNAGHALQRLLRECDVEINGRRDWDLQVHNPDTYARVLRDGSLGFGETYMEGWWDTKDLDGLLHRILSHRIDRAVHSWSDTFVHQHIREQFRKFQTELGKEVAAAVEAAKTALVSAAEMSATNAESIAGEVARLNTLRTIFATALAEPDGLRPVDGTRTAS